MEAYSSFISEHTAEFALIPRLTEILQNHYKLIVPIYPWMTKEGSILSRNLHSRDQFKMIALFPRRPKYSKNGLLNVYVKINYEIIQFYHVASKLGVPVIAGCPLIKNLWDLNAKFKCVWLKINEIAETEYLIEIDNHLNNIEDHDNFFYTNEEIINFFNIISYEINFDRALTMFKELKKVSTFNYFYGSTYKPIYFLLK
jgi:hypothetical protein